ncbi:MAG TPA: zf-HC2 domain-containing protein [Povalibacter sp.]|uniref:zf-HC2 domain-containing protein n=1 Tax=Povalibacter sp. TaxID=1962978 RepID=UPI002BC82FE2|nr:zf-HC2 domain-containing protein [Povalibacter sp.]HMN47064.1 zf-HC2 domain-containing protein [Povalibacter sp.]
MRAPHFNHERCWELIPWVVNGRASEPEQRDVLAHAADCSECREELARHHALHSQMRGDEDVIAAPNASWQKLLARIDAQPADSAAPRRIERPWLIAALWLQLVAIAVLAGALFRSAEQPAYTTLATTQPSDRRAAVRAVFAPGATLDEINQLLRQVGCDIVAGPSEAGVYTLAATDGDDVPGIIATLRKHPEVLFAERSQTASP